MPTILEFQTAPPVKAAAKRRLIKWFAEIGIEDVPLVGGKNASLGEMVRFLAEKGVKSRMALPSPRTRIATFCARRAWTWRFTKS